MSTVSMQSKDGVTTFSINKAVFSTVIIAALHVFLLSTLLLPGIGSEPAIRWSVLAAEGIFLLWQAILMTWGPAAGRPDLQLELKTSHYLPALLQTSLILYWGLGWHGIYQHVPELVVQVAFAYLFDLSFSWTTRRSWRFGFGPVPIVLSINFFLWFQSRYYYYQLGLIAATYLIKAIFTRKVGDKRSHIFNPSAGALWLVSIVIIATGTYEVTRADEVIPSFDLSLNMAEFLFLVSLTVNVFFPTILVTASAVATMFIVDAILIATTGLPMIPTPMDLPLMLGATLLVTDPATSPRGKTAKILFGMSYGLSTYALLWGLSSVEIPAYFDKVLALPILNFLVPRFDALGERIERALKAIPWYSWALNSRAFVLGSWCVFFVWIAAPMMKHSRPHLISLPGSIPATTFAPEMFPLIAEAQSRCREHPKLCAPFSFVSELMYRTRK